MKVLTDLTLAINHRRAVYIQNAEGLLRRVHPHCIYTSKKGDMILVAYQMVGISVSDEPEGWKQLKFENIVKVLPSTEVFDVQSSFKPSFYKDVLVMVETYAGVS